MAKRQEAYEFPDFELQVDHSDRFTDIELILQKLLPECPRKIRESGDVSKWNNAREELLNLIKNKIKGFQYVGEGKRYISYKVNNLLVKFLHINKARNINVNGKNVRKCGSKKNIFKTHAEEHEKVKNSMREMVPDSLFFHTQFDKIPGIEDTNPLKKINIDDVFLIIQEYIVNAVSILDACKDFRAETENFIKYLNLFLERYEKMRKNERVIPEVTSLKSQNALIGTDGRLWIPDTNNLIKTINYDGTPAKEYIKRFRNNDNFSVSDSLMRQIEDIIKKAEKGLLPENPQG